MAYLFDKRITKKQVSIFFFLTLLIYSSFIEVLISIFNFPDILRYFSDLIIIFLFVINFKDILLLFDKRFTRPLFIIVLFFLIYAFFLSFRNINFSNIIFSFWGIRTQFFYLFFVLTGIAVFNNINDFKKIYNCLIILFIFHFLLSIFEWSLGYVRDGNGGIFGIGLGCNGPSNVFMVIVLIMALFYKTKKQFSKIVCIILFSIIIATIAEIKIYYFELLFVLFIYIICYKFKIIYLLYAGCTFVLLFFFLKHVGPSFGIDRNIFSLEFIMDYINPSHGYSDIVSVNRIGGISKLTDILYGSVFDIEFFVGKGLGNATSSTISIFRSPFSVEYEYLKYGFFAYTYIFVEMGIIGVVFTILIYLNVILASLKQKNRFLLLVGGLFLLFLLFYNQTIVTIKGGYPFLVLPVIFGYALNKERRSLKHEY